MRTFATAGAEELIVPEPGETDNHGPPEVVDAEAEYFSDPDPVLRIVRFCANGSALPLVVWNRKPVCDRCKFASPPLTTTVTGTSNCACGSVIDTVPV